MVSPRITLEKITMMMPSNWAGDEVASLLKPNKIFVSIHIINNTYRYYQDSGK
jgi:hypothetical protein